MIDEAIEIVLKKRNEQPLGSLTSQDLFYVKTTRIHELFKALATISDELVVREQSTSRISQILLDVSMIVLVSLNLSFTVIQKHSFNSNFLYLFLKTILQEVIKFREANAALYAISAEKRDKFECLPWTATSGKNGNHALFPN